LIGVGFIMLLFLSLFIFSKPLPLNPAVSAQGLIHQHDRLENRHLTIIHKMIYGCLELTSLKGGEMWGRCEEDINGRSFCKLEKCGIVETKTQSTEVC
jgi:hypothetical protein